MHVLWHGPHVFYTLISIAVVLHSPWVVQAIIWFSQMATSTTALSVVWIGFFWTVHIIVYKNKTWNLQSNSWAVLAQLVERKALNLVVQGSSPWDGGRLFYSPPCWFCGAIFFVKFSTFFLCTHANHTTTNTYIANILWKENSLNVFLEKNCAMHCDNFHSPCA